MYTPDPTISNPQHQKVAGCTQLDIPSGELIRENTTGEPFEVIKLMHDEKHLEREVKKRGCERLHWDLGFDDLVKLNRGCSKCAGLLNFDFTKT